MFISCQLLPLLQMYISLQLLPSFQYFTLFRLLNDIKRCVGQVRVTLAPIWLLPITSPTYQLADNQLAYTISQLTFTICQLADTFRMSAKWPRMPSKWPVCRRVDQVRLLVSWPKASASWHVTVVTGYLKFTLVLQFRFQLFLLFSYLSLVKNSVHWTHHTGCSCSKHFLYLRKGWQNITLSFAK